MTMSITMELDEVAEMLDTERLTIGEENGCIVMRVPATSANRAVATGIVSQARVEKILRQHNLIIESVDVINNLIAASRQYEDIRNDDSRTRVMNAVRKSELYIEKTVLEARK